MAFRTLFWFSCFTLFSACWDGRDRYLGKLPAPVTKNVYFKVYQSNDFKQFTAISCEIVDEKDHLIAGPRFLTGTDLYEQNTDNFQVGEHDSILYLTYFRPNEVIGVYDLKSHTGSPFGTNDFKQAVAIGDSLLRKLRPFNDRLSGYWNH